MYRGSTPDRPVDATEYLLVTERGRTVTYRVTRWILQRLAIDKMSISATAKALGLGWDMVNDLALDACRALVYDDPGHLDGVKPRVL